MTSLENQNKILSNPKFIIKLLSYSSKNIFYPEMHNDFGFLDHIF